MPPVWRAYGAVRPSRASRARWQATPAELDAAINSAAAAFVKWRRTPVTARARVMLKLQELIKAHTDELAARRPRRRAPSQ